MSAYLCFAGTCTGVAFACTVLLCCLSCCSMWLGMLFQRIVLSRFQLGCHSMLSSLAYFLYAERARKKRSDTTLPE